MQAPFCTAQGLQTGSPCFQFESYNPAHPSPHFIVFYDFCESKAMVLFATDIAARGLDFPTVDWVIQVVQGLGKVGIWGSCECFARIPKRQGAAAVQGHFIGQRLAPQPPAVRSA